MPVEKMLPRFWGDNFFNPAKKTWTKSEVDGATRAFCKFILDPIIDMHNKVLADDPAWEDKATKLGIELKADDKKLKGKALLKKVFFTQCLL